MTLPVHRGTFNLAQPPPWVELAERTVAAARATGAAIATPRVGARWWRGVAVVPAGGWPVHPEPAAATCGRPADGYEAARPE